MSGQEREFEVLMEAVLGDAALPGDRAELARRVAADPALRREYVAQMRLHALLQWRSGNVPASADAIPGAAGDVIEFPPPHAARNRRAAVWLALAASILVICGVAAVWLFAGSGSPVSLVVIESENAVLADGSTLVPGARIRRAAFELMSGQLRFTTPAGALVSVSAPARLEVVSAMHLRVLAGRVTADVPERAHGFTIETANARIVDLGTRFGVEAGADGRTDVVVFEGKVDVARAGTRGMKRLTQGEAVRLDEGQSDARIENVHRGAAVDDWSLREGAGLIRRVRDNLRPAESAKFYEIVRGGLVEDTRAYVDRDHQWNGVDAAGMPEFLRGADLVRTFNDDKRATDFELTVELTAPATLYIFINKAPPTWLARAGFLDTGVQLGLDEAASLHRDTTTASGPGAGVDRIFSVWKLDVPQPGEVRLGPPREGPIGAKAMYGIAARQSAP